MTLDKWMKDLKYLPKGLQDFHNQKDLFKAIHGTLDISKNEYASKVDWITGHVYVIDIFLWFMAKHGYTLQKSKMKFPFKELETTIGDYIKAQGDAFFEMLKNRDKNELL